MEYAKLCALAADTAAALDELSYSPALAFFVAGEEGSAGEVVSVTKQGVEVRCGSGSVLITEAQFAGGKRLSAADIFNGRKICRGDMLE